MDCNHSNRSSHLSYSRCNPMLSRRPLRPHTLHQHELLRLSNTHQCKQKPRSLKVARSGSSHDYLQTQAFDTGRGDKVRLPTQGESVVRGSGQETMLQELPKPPADIDYLAVGVHCCFANNLCENRAQFIAPCRSSSQCSKAALKILDSLGQETWAFCTRT